MLGRDGQDRRVGAGTHAGGGEQALGMVVGPGVAETVVFPLAFESTG
jgi:hypothetical protein